MSQQKILVTGATGKTGKETVKLLLERGQAVRALVHRDDERAAALRNMGAEIVLGDLLDFESVRAAMEGMRTAYFVFPIRPGILQATTYFAQAGKEGRFGQGADLWHPVGPGGLQPGDACKATVDAQPTSSALARSVSFLRA